jgi:hypothetical protein
MYHFASLIDYQNYSKFLPNIYVIMYLHLNKQTRRILLTKRNFISIFAASKARGTSTFWVQSRRMCWTFVCYMIATKASLHLPKNAKNARFLLKICTLTKITQTSNLKVLITGAGAGFVVRRSHPSSLRSDGTQTNEYPSPLTNWTSHFFLALVCNVFFTRCACHPVQAIYSPKTPIHYVPVQNVHTFNNSVGVQHWYSIIDQYAAGIVNCYMFLNFVTFLHVIGVSGLTL